MREFGLTRLALPDGLVCERPELSPLERAVASDEAKPAADDDDDGIDAEERHTKTVASQWHDYWGRMLASSGGPVPAFPGVDQAQRFLGARS